MGRWPDGQEGTSHDDGLGFLAWGRDPKLEIHVADPGWGLLHCVLPKPCVFKNPRAVSVLKTLGEYGGGRFACLRAPPRGGGEGRPAPAPPPIFTLILPLQMFNLLVELDQSLRVLLLQELQALLQVQDPLLCLADPELSGVLPRVLEDCWLALAQARCAPGALGSRARGPLPGCHPCRAHVTDAAASAAAAARPLAGLAAPACRRVAMETGATEGAGREWGRSRGAWWAGGGGA